MNTSNKMQSVKMFILGFILFYAQTIFAQNHIRNYFTLINKAELYIVDSNYQEANRTYVEAFKLHCFFPKDLHNAFYSAYYAKDAILLKSYIDTLAFYGLRKSAFDGDYFPSDEWVLNLLSNYDTIQNLGKRVVNFEIARIEDSFFAIDQSIRYNATDTLDFQKKDSAKFFAYIDWLNENTYPTFQRTGFYHKSGYSLRSTTITETILWHFRNSFVPTEYKIKIRNLVLNGYLHPYDYIIGFSKEYKQYGLGLEKGQFLIEEVNKKREEIYLESMEDFYKKWNYNIIVKGDDIWHRTKFYFTNNFDIVVLNLLND